MKVFLSGSMSIRDIPNDWLSTAELTDVVSSIQFLIGDAPGTDRAIQEHLTERGIKDIVVYHATKLPRNNIGNNKTVRIIAGVSENVVNFFTAKDIKMSEDCDYGIVFWDGRSKGTNRNILRLLNLGKQVCIFRKIESSWTYVKLTEIADLNDWDKSLIKNKQIDLI